jgi:dephospho-CoA kinase
MQEWDASTFEDHLGKKVAWGMFTGRSFSGKKTVAAELCNAIKSKLVNMSDIAADLKKTMGSEEEPFDGEVPLEKVESAICAMIAADRAAKQKFTYLFESWMQKTATDFIHFMSEHYGQPTFVVSTTCDRKTAEERYKKKNETEEVTEDASQDLEDSAKKADK